MGLSKGDLFICVGFEAQLSIQSSGLSANLVGSSSAAQMDASTYWINSALGKPIFLIVTADLKKNLIQTSLPK